MRTFMIFVTLVIPLVTSFNLNCSTSGAMCNAELPGITSPNERITSVNGIMTPTIFHELTFEAKTVHYLPKGIAKFFPQLTKLFVLSSGLKSIQADDLEGLMNLEVLHIWGNDITELSGDLFRFTPKITVVSFPSNRIIRVGENLLKNLIRLDKLDFRCNKCIDGDTSEIDVESLKKELRIQCPDPLEMEATYCPEDLELYESDIGDLKMAMKRWIPTCSVYFVPDWNDILRNRTAKLEECRKEKAVAEDLEPRVDALTGNASEKTAVPGVIFACSCLYFLLKRTQMKNFHNV